MEPESPFDSRVAEFVGGVLGRRRVSVTESFFALGGDSIMSIQLSSLLRSAGYPLSPRDIFEAKTIRRLAAIARSAEVETLEELPGGGTRVIDFSELR